MKDCFFAGWDFTMRAYCCKCGKSFEENHMAEDCMEGGYAYLELEGPDIPLYEFSEMLCDNGWIFTDDNEPVCQECAKAVISADPSTEE